MQKKGQVNLGLITGLVMGIASLVIAVIIAFVIVSTLTDANLLQDSRTTSTVTNETEAYINTTGYTLTSFDNSIHLSPTITIVYNTTNETGGDPQGYNITILSGNYTVSSAGVLSNASNTNFDNVSISYTFTVKTSEELSADRLSANFSSGVDNISSKIPTILLIAAITLIIGILAILVGVWQRMKLGGGSL